MRLDAANQIKKAFDWRVDGSVLNNLHEIFLVKYQINLSSSCDFTVHCLTRDIQAIC